MKKIFLLFISFFPALLYPEVFQYKFIPDSKQKIEARIEGKQYQNDQFLLAYYQYYKTIRTYQKVENNSGTIEDSNYFYNQNTFATNKILELKNEVTVNYTKDPLGYMNISVKSNFPTLRNAPVFPDKDIQPGDEWTASGAELQDLFNDGYISTIPLEVKYKFLGYEELEGKKLAKFKYEHNINVANGNTGKLDPRIQRIVGESMTVMYFDNELGSRVKEEYSRDYAFLLSYGNTKAVVEFIDSGIRTWTQVELMNKDKIVDDLKNRLKEEKIPDADVKKDKKGVKILLENLHFKPDSSELVPEDISRLDKIANILKNYKEKGTMIIGHTTDKGTEEGRQKLSLERSKRIVDYLASKDSINLSKSSYGGKGGTEPIADNSTEEGMKKNRRVEIYILEE